MIVYTLLLLVPYFLPSPFLYAHELPELHDQCLTATDYKGCIKHNKKAVKPNNTKPSYSAQWRKYGPLRVNWEMWATKGNSHIAPTLNLQKKPLYLAINCYSKKINVKELNGDWKGWEDPKQIFEKSIIYDLCLEKKDTSLQNI